MVLLEGKVALYLVDNLRPVLERENLKPARDKIHDLFMEHVMQQAPGYAKLMAMTRTADEQVPIMPTPGAVGLIMQAIADNDFQARGAEIAADEVFVSDGAKCDTGNIQELFSLDARVAIPDPVYPVYPVKMIRSSCHASESSQSPITNARLIINDSRQTL